MAKFQVITIGSAVRDIMFRTAAAEIIKNPHHDPTKVSLIGFEYGAKIHSEQVHRYYGGGAMNTAVCFARLGLQVAACVRVGRDADGAAAIQHLRAEKVHTQFVQQDKQRNTGLSFLIVETKTNEHVALVDYGANNAVTLPRPLLTQPPAWFYVSSLSTPRWPQLVKALIRTKAQLAWNPGAIQLSGYKSMRPLLKYVDLFILNQDEATELTLYTKLSPAQFGPDIVVVTAGRHGATAYTAGRRYTVKPKSNHAKDTTGAGDAFGSSLVAGLMRTDGNLPVALRIASINATAEVSQIGVQQGLLRWPDIQKKLKQQR